MAFEKQPQNELAKFIGTGEFRFAEGFTTGPGALGKPFRDFQNLTAFTWESNSESKVIVSSRRGMRVEEGTRVTLQRFGYQFKTDSLTVENALYLFAGEKDPAGNYTQPVRAAVAADAITTPVAGPWYDLTVSGAEVRNLTAVAITSTPSKTEDVDYVVDYLNGAIRFITAPGTITSILVTAPAITVTSPLSLARANPRVTPIRRGIGRVLLYDRVQAAQDLVYDHRDFYCEVMASGNVDQNGQAESEITMHVKVLTPTGSIRMRESDYRHGGFTFEGQEGAGAI